MNFAKIMGLLFQDTDYVCYGTATATHVFKRPNSPLAEFFCINPIHPLHDRIKTPTGAVHVEYNSIGRRADLNVTRFQNFLFEIDNMPLDEQLKLFQNCKVPWASIVYSGSKSYHAILSLETPLDCEPHTLTGVETYKAVWRSIAATIAKRSNIDISLLDHATQNPSRLSRMPEGLRGDVVQELMYVGKLCSTQELNELLAESPIEISMKRNRPNVESNPVSEEEIKLLMPAELLARLKFPKSWAVGEAGNYPELWKLLTWTIDSTNLSKSSLQNLLEKWTFPELDRLGYPRDKMYKVLEDVCNFKELV